MTKTTAALIAEYEAYLSASHVTERQHERMIELSRLLGRGVFERAERADPQTTASLEADSKTLARQRDSLRSAIDQALHRRADRWRKEAAELSDDEDTPCLIRADECEEIARMIWAVKEEDAENHG